MISCSNAAGNLLSVASAQHDGAALYDRVAVRSSRWGLADWFMEELLACGGRGSQGRSDASGIQNAFESFPLVIYVRGVGPFLGWRYIRSWKSLGMTYDPTKQAEFQDQHDAGKTIQGRAEDNIQKQCEAGAAEGHGHSATVRRCVCIPNLLQHCFA